MDSVGRGLAVYLFLLLVFRLADKRTLAQTTPFDLILLLLISETTQQAMVADDRSMTNGALLVVTLVGADILLSWLKLRSPLAARLLDDKPLILVHDGKPIRDRMKKARVDESEVLVAARREQGLARMDQIKFAVLETSGEISIVPKGPQRA